MFAGKKSAQIREILISESAWEEMTCLFAPSLEELRGQFYGQMYKINPEIISRFLIKSTPTIISVEGTYFKVQQFAQADVREYTRLTSSPP